MRRFLPILLAGLTICLAGCSDHDTSSADAPTPDRVVPVPYTGPASPTNLLTPSDVPTAGTTPDPVMHGGDTLASGGHALDSGDPIAGADPIAKSHDISSPDDPLSGMHSGARRVGWYWLRGTIRNGRVAVALNGVPCGQFTEFTDRELTRYVTPGMNHVTFTSISMSAMRPLDAHLVLYMRAASADVHQTVPAAVYDSAPMDAEAPPPSPASPAPLHLSGMPTPVVRERTVPQPAGPRTQVLTFFAK